MRTVLLTISLLLLMTVPAHAKTWTPAFVTAQIPDAQVVGEGRMRYMFMNVYDAVLYAPKGRWKEGQPLALRLTYLQAINGSTIARTSIGQIRAQGFADEKKLDGWYKQMRAIFPDVKPGTSLTGIFDSRRETVFLRNGREIGRISDPEFGRCFFGIWFDRRTTDPKLRAELLGFAAKNRQIRDKDDSRAQQMRELKK